MERSRWLEAVRRVARELPEEARVIVLLQPSSPATGAERAVIELATALARRRPRVLLIDLGASEGALCRTFGAAGAAGLREVLRGQATAVETAVRVRERGFIYLPPGPADASEPAADPALRILIERARAGGATTLLCGLSAPRRLREVADGIVPIEAEAGGRIERAAPPGRRATGPTGRPPALHATAGLPTLGRLVAPGSDRRLIAAGRVGRGADAPCVVRGRGASPGRRRGRRPRGARRGRPSRPRPRQARTGSSPGAQGPAAVLVPLALLAYSVLLAVLIAVGFRPGGEADPADPEDGVAAPAEAWSAGRLLAPHEARAEPDSPGSRLPAALPFSTFSIGAALRPFPFLDSTVAELSPPEVTEADSDADSNGG